MISKFRHSMCTFVLVVCGTALGVGATPPDKRTCDGEIFTKLECRQQAIADQMAFTAEVLNENTELGQQLNPTHRKQLNNAKNKADRAKRKNDAAFFKRNAKSQTQANRQEGFLVPLDDALDDVNGDGVCDWGQEDSSGLPIGRGTSAECLAIELKDNGETQACNPEKKNKGRGKDNNLKFAGFECDRATDFDDSVDGPATQDMQESADLLEESYDVAESNLLDMNTQLENVNSALESTGTVVMENTNGCQLPDTTPGLAEAAEALAYVKSSTAGTAGIMDSSLGQTIFGSNARGAATVFNAISAAADIAFIAIEFRLQEESGALQEAIASCVAGISEQLAELRVLMQNEHAHIIANDDENTANIIRELNTPQGRREQFPVK